MRRSQLVAFVGGAAVALLVGSVPALAALGSVTAGPVESPRVSIGAMVFRVGAAIDAARPASGDGCSGYQTAVPLQLSWTGSDGSTAIVDYDVSRFDGASAPSSVGTMAGGSGGSLSVTGSNYESECGGGITPTPTGSWPAPGPRARPAPTAPRPGPRSPA